MTEAIRVLCVDDETTLLEICKTFLESSHEFSVITVRDAANAIGLLEHEKFDVIVSDYQMPKMDGIRFLVEVRKRFGPIPFILFTGKGREEVVIQAINSGADFYLQKGGEPEAQFAELEHAIKRAVTASRGEENVRVSRDKLLTSELDLRIHQTELKTQADELRRVNLALEESRDKYLDLYEFAPVGYITLSDKALIDEVNLTGTRLLGNERKDLIRAPFSKFVTGTDTDTWYRYFMSVLKQNENQACTLSLTRGDGSTFPARLESIRIHESNTGTSQVRVAISDITDIKLMESEIRSLNTVLEQRVRERTASLVETNKILEEENARRLIAENKLQASYEEKVMLLKEVHHRVKNNLQIIASLLNLQSRYIGDPSTLAAIRESQNRIKAMALVHEKLYRAEDIAHIDLHDYIQFLGDGLFQAYEARNRGIRFMLEIHDIDVNIDTAVPLGLIVNELISNSLKYAFPDERRGEIFISVKKDDPTLTLLYRDTGVGMPADMNWREAPSLGLRLINSLVDQMNGTVDLEQSGGTVFTIVLYGKGQPKSC